MNCSNLQIIEIEDRYIRNDICNSSSFVCSREKTCFYLQLLCTEPVAKGVIIGIPARKAIIATARIIEILNVDLPFLASWLLKKR